MPFPVARERVPVAHTVRSTLISSSQLSLREHGLYDRYVASLPAADHDRVLYVPAGTWLPLDAAIAHYAACESLDLGENEILSMGNAVGKATQRTALAMLLKTVKEAGATPMAFFTSSRFWARLFAGGAVACFKLGPKEARFETVGVPLARFRYWRVGYRGLLSSVVAPFCTEAYAQEIANLHDGQRGGVPVFVGVRFRATPAQPSSRPQRLLEDAMR